MTGGNLYIVSLMLWIIWGISLIKRTWKGFDKQVIEFEIYILYTLALIFIGTVFLTIGII